MTSKEEKISRMSPDRDLQTYSIPQLERIASEQLKKLQELTIPVDIERIVEIHNIDLDVRRGLQEIHHIWGMVAINLHNQNLIILVDEKLMDLDSLLRVYRMTVAEEFAHVLLHKAAIEKARNIEDFKALQKHPNWHEHDRNAKWLAAALLMPAAHVLEDSRNLYQQVVSTAGFGDPEAIRKYVRNLLADKYDVSVSAMNYRLENWPVNVREKIDRAMENELDFLD